MYAITPGFDSFGKMNVTHHMDGTSGKYIHCAGCDSEVLFGVWYHPNYPQLPNKVAVDKTILKDPENVLGISCGCYARFHRQIVHIENRMKAR
jgi:hypothetical protein